MRSIRDVLVSAAVGLILASCTQAIERGRNLIVNPDMEVDGGWQPVGSGFTVDTTTGHSGRRSLRCNGTSLDSVAGAMQAITLNPPVRHPFRVTGWSRAKEAQVGQDYNIYLDMHHDDGTPLWGQIASFEPGTHDWQKAEMTVVPAKPIQRIEVYLLFRKAAGTVWFDDITVEAAPFEFERFKVLANPYRQTGIAVVGSLSLPARWQVSIEGAADPQAEQKGEGTSIRMIWPTTSPSSGAAAPGDRRVLVTATDLILGETIRQEQKIRLQPSAASPPYAVWTESSMQRVPWNALPPATSGSPTARIALAGREYESFQVVLATPPGNTLESVEVSVSDLVCEAKGSRIEAGRVQWHLVGHVKVDRLRPHPADPDAAPGWWPDPLLPVKRFNVIGGFAQPLWVTVCAPPQTPGGEYVGKLTLKPRTGTPSEIEIRATVYGFDLPVQGHLKTAFALMDGFLEKVYGKPLGGDLRRKYGDFLLQHRLNPDDISRTAPPAIDDLVHYRDRGLNAFNILNMVEERGDRTWVCYSELPVYTPAFKKRLIERIAPCVDSLRREGLIDRAYIYTFDERDKSFYPVMREYFGMVKERFPGVRTLTTAYVPQDPNVMRDLNVDWNCPLTPAYQLPLADRCRAAGLQVWAYVCCGPGYPYANWLAHHPLVESRVLWWQAFHQKMDGILYWGLNIWDLPGNDKPIDPNRASRLDWSITTGGEWDWLHGDGRLIYAGIDGPIGSIRLANIRDGLEDYEYLWLLSQRSGGVERAREACLPVTQTLTLFTRDPQVLARQRQAIASQIGP